MVFDQEGKNIKLNEGEFNTVGALSWETGFNTLTKTPGGEVNLLQGWILETPKKWWPTLSEVQMSEFLWQWLKEENERIKEVGVLECKYYIKPENPA